MAILYQNPNSTTLYIGWYAGDGTEFECEDFSLIVPNHRDKLLNVFQSKTLNDGFNGFDANLPAELDDVAQPFTKLECGKAYFITLKQGNDSLYIENFTYTNTGTSTETYLSDQKPFLESRCTFQTYNITENSFDLNIYLDTIIPSESTNGYLKSLELEFSNVILDGDQPIICHTFSELKAKYSLEGNSSAYDLYTEFHKNTKTAFSTDENGNRKYNKIIVADLRENNNGLLLQDAPNIFRFTVYCDTHPHWQMDISSSVLYDSSNPVGEYESVPCFNPEPTPTPTSTPTHTPTHTPTPAFQLFSDLLSVEESSKVKFTLITTGYTDGSEIPWEITFNDSVDNEDFTQVPTGKFIVENNQATTLVEITEDYITEGIENFRFHAIDRFVDIEIIDTSNTQVPNPSTITPTSNNAPTWSWNSIKTGTIYEITLNDEILVDSQTSTSFTPTMLSAGFHTIKVRAKKVKGTWSDYGVHTVDIDLISPSIPQPTTTTPTQNKTPTWTWSENLDVVEYEVVLDSIVFGLQSTNKFTSSTLIDGTHEIKVRAKDSVGNWSSFGSHTILIDTSSPNVPRPFTQSPTNNNTPTWSWLQVTDAVLYEVTLNNITQGSQESTTFTSSTLQDGIHEIKVRSKDEIGNWSSFGSHTILIDTLAPILPNPNTISPTNNNTPTWSWTSSTDAILYEVKLNDVTQLVQTKNSYKSETLSDGVHKIEVRAKDKNDNWSEYAIHEVTIDTQPPEIPNPNTGTPTNELKPTWTWQTSSDVSLYEISLNGIVKSSQTTNSFTSDSDLQDGSNEIKVRAKDEVGNWSSHGTHIVTIDTNAPNVPTPIAETPSNEINPTWNWKVNEDSSLYEVILNNIEQGTQTETSFTASSLPAGNHEIKVRSQDLVGNWSSFGSHTIYIDTQAPDSPNILSKTPTNNLKPTWTWNSDKDAIEYEVTLNNDIQVIQTSNVFKPQFDLSEGNNEIKVRAKDNVGNYSTFAVNVVNIDATAPNIPNPSASSPTSNNQPTWNWAEIADAVSYEVTLDEIIQGTQINTSFKSFELSDGTHQIKVRAKDNVGNYSSHGSHIIEVDTTSTEIPNPASLTPTNNIRPTWNWSDIHDAELYEITLNNVLETTTTNTFFTPSFDFDHGQHEIKIRAKDSVGNWSNYGTHVINVDLFAPEIPQPNAFTPTNNLLPTWNWNLTPDAVEYEISINGEFIKKQSGLIYKSTSELTEGLNELQVRAKDSVGNYSGIGSHIVDIIITPPDNPQPNTETPTNNNVPTWTWSSVLDAVEYEVTLNGLVIGNQTKTSFVVNEELNTGNHEIKVRAKDAVGNYSNYGTHIVEIDTSAPDIPRPNTNTPTNNNTPTWTWNKIQDAVEYEIIIDNEFKQTINSESYTSSSFQDGEHEIKVRSVDAVGNYSAYGSHIVIIDTLAPDVPQPNSNTPTKNTSIKWTWLLVQRAVNYEVLYNNDPQQLQTSTTFKIDNLSEGEHEIKVRSVDAVGNYSEYGSHTVTIDLTSPDVPVPITSTPTNNTSPTWSWGVVVDAIEYDVLLDGIFQAKQSNTNFTASNLTEGTHEIKVCATDSVGNKSEFGSHVVSIDLTAPYIPHPKTTTPTSNESPTWTWNTNEDVVEYEIILDSVSQGKKSDATFTASDLSEGSHELKVRARDSVGNWSAYGSHVVVIDTTSPFDPQPSTHTPTNNNSPIWSWSANPDVVEYEITLDSVILGTQSETTFSMPSLTDGNHELKVRAKDSVGNWSAYGIHVVKIDTQPPTIPTPTTSSPVNNTNPVWSWSQDDDVVEYEVILNDVVQTNQTQTLFTATGLSDGNNEIKVRAKDAVGNYSAYGSHYVKIDTTPPVVPLPTSLELTSNNTPTWTWIEVQDAVLYDVVLNNIPQGEQTENTFTSNLTLVDGTHEIRVRAKDSVGNYSAYGTHIVKVDLTAPNIPLPNTSSPTNNNKPLWIWNAIHDAVLYEVTLDGVLVGTQNKTTFKPLFTLLDGEHELKVRAKDSVGNFSEYGVSVVIVDITSPGAPVPSTTTPTSNNRPVWTWSEITDAIIYEITLNNIVIGNQTESMFTSSELLTDGTHEIKVRSKDLVGNYSTFGVHVVQIDKTAPNIPSPNTITPTKNETPSWTWNNILDATEYEVILDNIVQGTQTTTEFTSPSALSEGMHEVKVRAKDSVGNWSVYGSHIVTIDSTAPVIPNPQTDTPTSNNKPVWSWQPIQDAVLYEVNLDGVSHGTQSETFFETSFVLGDGLHELRVRSQDEVGNWSSYGLHILLVDTTPTDIPNPSTTTPTNNDKPTWSWSAISKAVLYEVTLNGVVVSNQTDTSFTSSKILNDGNHEIKIRAKDIVGNWSDYGVHVVTIDKTPTSIPSPVTNTPTNNNKPTWTWSPVSGAVEYEVVLDNISHGIQTSASFVSTSTLSDGTHELKVRAKDAVGNWSSYGIHVVEVDTTAPDVPVPFTQTPTNNNTPSWSWNNVPSSVEYQILLNEVSQGNQTANVFKSKSTLSDGNHEIKVRSRDSVGNWSLYGSHTIEIDTTPPTAPVPSTTTPTNNQTPEFTWQVVGGAISYEVILNNVVQGIQNSTSFVSPVLTDGNHEIKVRSIDALGNYSTPGSFVALIDTKPPHIPKPNTTTPTPSTTPTWTWSAIGDVVLYEITLNNVLQNTQITTSYTTSVLDEGTHTIKVRAKDFVGNWSAYGTHTIEIIDVVPPNVPNPTSETPTKDATPTWTWSSDSDAMLYEVVLNDVIQGTQTTTTFTANELRSGTHILKVRSQDDAGNWSEFGTSTIFVDITAPHIPKPITDSPTNNDTPTWNWSTISDAVEYEVTLNNVIQQIQTETSFTPTALFEGANEIRVRAKDSIGNYSNYGTHVVFIDLTSPESPVPNTESPTSNSRPTWTWSSISDAIEYEVLLNGNLISSQTISVFISNETLDDGIHELKVRAKDNVGNYSEYGISSVVIDTNSPNIPQPSTSTPTSDNTPTWTWSAISDAVEYEVKLNGVVQLTQTSTSFTASTLSSGNHQIQVRAKDAVGNWSDYGTHIVNVDTESPLIPNPTSTTPTNNNTPTWTWSEILDAVEYEVILNNIFQGTITNNTFTSNILNEGVHEIKVRAKDSVGNYSPFGNHTIIVDTTAPHIPNPVTNTPTNDNTPTWNWSVNSDAVEYEVVLDEVSLGVQSNTSFTSTNLSDGTHEIKIRSCDFVGNWSNYGSHIVLIDTTPPSDPVVSANTPTNNNRPTWSWEKLNDAVEYEVTLNDVIVSSQVTTEYSVNTNLNDGNHTLKVRAKDLVGNYSNYTSFSVLIDTTPPNVPKPDTNTPTNNNNPTWNWVNIIDAILYEVLIDGVIQGTQTQTSFTKNLSDGEHEIKVRAKDSVGNYSAFGSHKVIVDTTSTEVPTPSAVSPTSNVNPTWSWQIIQDAVSYEIYLNEQLQGTQIETFFESPSLDDGTNIIKVRAYDSVGNVSLFGSHSVLIDTTAPNIPQPATQSPTNDNSPTWSWNFVADATQYEVILDEVLQSIQLTNTFTSSALSDGNHTLKVRTRDALGNYSGYGIHVVTIDTTSPASPILFVNSPTNDDTPTWTWNVDSDIQEYELLFNNEPQPSQSENSFTSTKLHDGTHELKVRGRDSNNNFSAFAISKVLVDTNGPTIPNPTTNTPTNNSKPSWSWTPISDAVEYEIYMNGVLQNSQSTTTYTSSTLAEGNHEIKVRAKDAVGNYSLFGVHVVTIDNTSPNAPTPNTETPTNGRTPTWSWSSVHDAVTYEISLNGIILLSQTDTTFTSSYLNDGTHEFKVRAKDIVGNFSEHGVHVVTIDNSAPSIPSPSTSSPTNNTNPTWNWADINDAVAYEIVLNNITQATQTETSFTSSQVLSNGTHQFKVRAKDSVGNWSVYGTHTITIDTDAPDVPDIDVNSPTSNSTPTWTWNENFDVVEYEVLLDSVSQGTTSLNFFKSNTLQDGNHELKVRAKDSVGNYSSFGTKLVLIDTTPPSIPIPTSQTPTNNKSPNWSWNSIQDAIEYEIVLDNVLIASQTASSYSAINLSDGNHEIKVRAKDAVGNYSNYGTHIVVIDATAPTIPSPFTLTPTSNRTPTWNWSEINNSVEYEITLNSVVQSTQNTTTFTSSELPEGTHTLKVRAKDSVGNWSEFGNSVIEIDTTAPDAPQPTTITPTKNTEITWHWQNILTAIEYEVLINNVNMGVHHSSFFETNILPDGLHEIKVRAKDSVGNYSAYGSHVVVIDKTAPNIPNPTSSTPTQSDSPTWTWNKIADAIEYDITLNGVVIGTQISNSYTSSNLQNGTHEIRVRAKDSVGNYSAYGTHVVTIDNTAPRIPNPVSNTPTNNTMPSWTWPSVEGVDAYEVVLNSVSQGTQTENSFTTASNLQEGEYKLQVRAVDGVGNWSLYGSFNVTIDLTAPNIPTPTAFTPTNDNTPTWNWNEDTDVVEYEIVLNGVEQTTQKSTSFMSGQLSDGIHEIKVRAKDSVGNYSDYGVHTILIDTIAPIVPNLTSPSPTNNDSPTWFWTTSNDIESYEITLDGVLIGSQTASSYSAINLSEGNHELKVRAKDSVGNYSEYGINNIIIDLTAPTIPNPTTYTPTNNSTITWSWQTNNDAVEYEVILDDVSLGSQTENTFTTSSLTDGSHTIKVRSKDEVGNLSGYGIHTVVVDTTSPDAPSPATFTPTNDQTPTWSWQHEGGVANYEITLDNVIIGTQTSNYFTPSSLLENGTHELKVTAIDFAGNESLTGVHIVTIDTIPPSIPFPSTLTPTNNVNPEWSWNSNSDVVLYEVILDNIVKGTQTDTNFFANNLSDGTHEIQIRAKDIVGNWSEFGTHIVNIDSTPPSIPRPYSVSPTSNQNPTWTWASVVGAVEYEITLDNIFVQTQTENIFDVSSNLSEGSHTIKVRSKDALGNFSEYGTHVIVIDITAPIVPTPSTNTPTNNNRPTWSWSDVDDAVEYEINIDGVVVNNQDTTSYTSSLLHDGSHEISVRAKDNVGNWSLPGSHVVWIDTSAPSVPQPNTHSPTKNNTPSWSWSVDEDVVLYEVMLDNVVQGTQTDTLFVSSKVLSDGNHVLKVRAKDSVGNWSDFGSDVVTIDTTPPALPYPTTTSPTKNNIPTWVWSRDGYSDTYEVTLNNIIQGTQSELSFTPSLPLSDGLNVIQVRSIDEVGNYSNYGIGVVLIDTTPPSIPVPVTQTPTANNRPTWSWHSVDDAIFYEVTLNDVLIGTQTSTSFTSPLLLADGTSEIKVRAKDEVGNYSHYGNHVVLIDTDPPNTPNPSTYTPTPTITITPTITETDTSVTLDSCCDGLSESTMSTSGSLTDKNAVSGTTSIDGTLCWNTLSGTSLPQSFLCPFEVADFSKGGLSLTISAPLNNENNLFRYETDDGNCYEFIIENINGLNIGKKLTLTK